MHTILFSKATVKKNKLIKTVSENFQNENSRVLEKFPCMSNMVLLCSYQWVLVCVTM